jgi:hypothetical protein
LETVRDPIPFFFIFGVHYRNSGLAKDGHAIRAHTMEETFCAISTTMAGMGPNHKQLDPSLLPDQHISTAAAHLPNKARSRQLNFFSLSRFSTSRLCSFNFPPFSPIGPHWAILVA